MTQITFAELHDQLVAGKTYCMEHNQRYVVEFDNEGTIIARCTETNFRQALRHKDLSLVTPYSKPAELAEVSMITYNAKYKGDSYYMMLNPNNYSYAVYYVGNMTLVGTGKVDSIPTVPIVSAIIANCCNKK